MRVAVLGPVVVENGPRLAGRERVVLSALVVSMGSVCPADRLAAALYGDDLPATWRKVVQGTIVRLRRSLGAAAIETTPDGYRLAIADDEVDLRRLERLLDRAKQLLGDGDYDRAVAEATEALALFRGEPLVELDGWPPGRAEAARIVELRHLGEDRLLDGLLTSAEQPRRSPTASGSSAMSRCASSDGRRWHWRSIEPAARAKRCARSAGRAPCSPKSSGSHLDPTSNASNSRSSPIPPS